MIDLVQQLYQVERAAAEDADDARRVRRQAHSVPLLDAIRRERDALAAVVLPKSPLGEAVRYLTNQWDALQRFTEDGRFRIDNNGAENQLRGVAIGRKNWLFAGSFEGASARGAPLFPRPELHADRRLALRLSERRPDPRRHASAAADWAAHAHGLGRHVRSARRRLSAVRDQLPRFPNCSSHDVKTVFV